MYHGYNDTMYLLIMEAGMDFYQDSLPENRAIKILVLFERISMYMNLKIKGRPGTTQVALFWRSW